MKPIKWKSKNHDTHPKKPVMERIYNFINYNQFHEAERLIRITQTTLRNRMMREQGKGQQFFFQHRLKELSNASKTLSIKKENYIKYQAAVKFEKNKIKFIPFKEKIIETTPLIYEKVFPIVSADIELRAAHFMTRKNKLLNMSTG